MLIQNLFKNGTTYLLTLKVFLCSDVHKFFFTIFVRLSKSDKVDGSGYPGYAVYLYYNHGQKRVWLFGLNINN